MKKNKAFTLTELLIVVGIIAFLASMIAFFFRNQIFKGYDARRKTDLRRIGIAVEEYEKDNDCYPLPNLVTCVNKGIGLRPYLDQVPCDPVTNVSYYYEHEDSVCPGWYRLYSSLQNKSDGDYTAGIGPNSSYNYVVTSPNAPSVGAGVGATQAPSWTPGPGSTSIPQVDFYGCFSGVCTPIAWDPIRNNPECDPNFQNSTCYGQCANLANECQSWKK